MSNLSYLISCKSRMETLLWKHSDVNDWVLQQLNLTMLSVERLEDDDVSFEYLIEMTKFHCIEMELDPDILDEIENDQKLEVEYLNYWTYMRSVLNAK